MTEFLLDRTYYFMGHPPMTFLGRDVLGGFVFRAEGLLKTLSIEEAEALVVQRPKPPEPELVWVVLRDFSPGVRAMLGIVAAFSGGVCSLVSSLVREVAVRVDYALVVAWAGFIIAAL